MILSDKKILEKIDSGEIIITPFDISNMGGNSYDVHLSKHFAQYVDKEIMQKRIMKLDILKYPKKVMCFNLENYIYVQP